MFIKSLQFWKFNFSVMEFLVAHIRTYIVCFPTLCGSWDTRKHLNFNAVPSQLAPTVISKVTNITHTCPIPDDVNLENVPPPPPPILEDDFEDTTEETIDDLAELMNQLNNLGQDLDQEASALQNWRNEWIL